MPNYHNSKIYKIWSPSTDMVYIGSTTQSLALRLGGHVSNYKSFLHGKKIRISKSFEILKYKDYKIELIEKIDCNCKEELARAEGKVIRNTQNCVNIRVEGRTIQEWRREHKEKIAEQNAVWYQKNKERIAKKEKKYYKKNKKKILEKQKIKITCECGSIIRRCAIARHKKSLKHIDYIKNL